MSNLDFSAQPLFSWYVVLLALSGIIMLVLGVLPLGGLKVGLRTFNVLFALGFLGYAYYLVFVFEGSEYTIYYKAFILPVAMTVASVKAIVEHSNEKNRPTPPARAYNPNAPYAPGAAQPAAFNPVAPVARQPGQPVPPQGASPYQPGAPAQPVADNPYAQPQPPQQPAG
ncbi:hypothetical protein ACIG0C_14140 [Kitasatospora aureofaciens]|uniref:Uncharacterized protein n=1 Tax=Kitasatospora aureofaciens TaxID=1894 RepID=A0A1E7N5W8_KITAU|nr:hypothetical protein [Kitasatospora aureofaciens]ARF80042.1 hypothetical protein B6264_14970 [Kitasatospora aureofaciens]OEV36097.1 hypothetical protein HS99_0030990 [Kitasatospora aureofaciens]GGU91801.1 hypothetical protein GCM10010502_51640 [Kitasatospora aureofaciens]